MTDACDTDYGPCACGAWHGPLKHPPPTPIRVVKNAGPMNVNGTPGGAFESVELVNPSAIPIEEMSPMDEDPRKYFVSSAAAYIVKILDDHNLEFIREVFMQNEVDPNGLDAKAKGDKLDSGKAPIFRGVLQYFPRAVTAVANLSQTGAEKYSWKGWEHVPDGVNRYGDALARHIAFEAIDGLYDPEWTDQGKAVLHATAVAWNALARLELVLRELENDTPEPSTIGCDDHD